MLLFQPTSDTPGENMLALAIRFPRFVERKTSLEEVLMRFGGRRQCFLLPFDGFIKVAGLGVSSGQGIDPFGNLPI